MFLAFSISKINMTHPTSFFLSFLTYKFSKLFWKVASLSINKLSILKSYKKEKKNSLKQNHLMWKRTHLSWKKRIPQGFTLFARVCAGERPEYLNGKKYEWLGYGPEAQLICGGGSLASNSNYFFSGPIHSKMISGLVQDAGRVFFIEKYVGEDIFYNSMLRGVSRPIHH